MLFWKFCSFDFWVCCIYWLVLSRVSTVVSEQILFCKGKMWNWFRTSSVKWAFWWSFSLSLCKIVSTSGLWPSLMSHVVYRKWITSFWCEFHEFFRFTLFIKKKYQFMFLITISVVFHCDLLIAITKARLIRNCLFF